MSMNEETHATNADGTTVIHLRTGCNIKSPALRRAMHKLVGNITAGVAQVVATECATFIEAMEEAFEQSFVGGGKSSGKQDDGTPGDKQEGGAE